MVPFVRYCGKMWYQPCRPQMAIWLMRIACWIIKTTHTHTHTLRIYNTHCFSTATMVARTLLTVTLHVQCLSCYLLEL